MAPDNVTNGLTGHDTESVEQTNMETGAEAGLTSTTGDAFIGAGSVTTPVTNTPVTDDEAEFAAEVAPAPRAVIAPSQTDRSEIRRGEGRTQAKGNQMMGWLALIAAIASLFLWPAVLGPAAVLLGFVAWVQGSRALGVWSIVLGIISFVAYLALVPLYS